MEKSKSFLGRGNSTKKGIDKGLEEVCPSGRGRGFVMQQNERYLGGLYGGSLGYHRDPLGITGSGPPAGTRKLLEEHRKLGETPETGF